MDFSRKNGQKNISVVISVILRENQKSQGTPAKNLSPPRKLPESSPKFVSVTSRQISRTSRSPIFDLGPEFHFITSKIQKIGHILEVEKIKKCSIFHILRGFRKFWRPPTKSTGRITLNFFFGKPQGFRMTRKKSQSDLRGSHGPNRPRILLRGIW